MLSSPREKQLPVKLILQLITFLSLERSLYIIPDIPFSAQSGISRGAEHWHPGQWGRPCQARSRPWGMVCPASSLRTVDYARMPPLPNQNRLKAVWKKFKWDPGAGVTDKGSERYFIRSLERTSSLDFNKENFAMQNNWKNNNNKIDWFVSLGSASVSVRSSVSVMVALLVAEGILAPPLLVWRLSPAAGRWPLSSSHSVATFSVSSKSSFSSLSYIDIR